MNILTPGLQCIRRTGKVLAWAAFFGAMMAFFQYIFNELHILPQPLLGIELMLIGCIIPALYLLKGGYIAARRVAILAMTSLTISFTLGFTYLFSVFYQLTLAQMFAMLCGTWTFLLGIIIAGHLGNFIFHLWIYRQLTTPIIRNESQAANILYRPFWRFSPFRGIFIGLLFISSTMNSFGTFDITTTRVHEDVKKQYGPAAYVFVQHIMKNKGTEKIFAESIVFDGKKYFVKKFSL
ncbi:MAG: hypothetical protein SFW66_06860 [Gammaproteobacteria bacterium]|nr:hypothetical protein [Gammaproteobacteria bacterium]